jgi:hypothetical protein
MSKNLKKHTFAGNVIHPTNYCGTEAGFYISKALALSVSLEELTMMENIKFKQAISRMELGSVVSNSTCDFETESTIVLTERSLQPKNLQVNMQYCKTTLLNNWESLQMKAGAWNNTAPTFDEYLISLTAKEIAAGVENAVWNGTAAASGSFQGFLGATGTFVGDATINNVVNAGTPFVQSNVILNMSKALAAVPSTVYGKEDLRMYINYKTYRLYIAEISKLGYVNAYNMNSDYVPVFEGVKLAVSYGMADNKIVVAEKSNLFFGTDLLSDQTEIRTLDMSNLDGSNNVRIVAKYSAGVQHGVGADITFLK